MSRTEIRFVPTERANFEQANDLFKRALKYGQTGTQAIVDTVNKFGENTQQNNQAQIANYINGLSKEDLANRDAVLQGINDVSKDSFMGYNMASVVDYLDKRPTELNTRARDDITTQTVVDDDIVNRASTALAMAKQGILEAKSPEEKAQATDVFTTLSKALTPTDPYLAGRIADSTIEKSDKIALRNITNSNSYNTHVDTRDDRNAGKISLLQYASSQSEDPSVINMYNTEVQKYLQNNAPTVLALANRKAIEQRWGDQKTQLDLSAKASANSKTVADIANINANTKLTESQTTGQDIKNVDAITNPTDSKGNGNTPASVQIKAFAKEGLPANIYNPDGTLNRVAVSDVLFGSVASAGNEFGGGVISKYATLSDAVKDYRTILKNDANFSSPQLFGVALGTDGDRFGVIQNIIDNYKDPKTGKPLPEKMKAYIADRIFANAEEIFSWGGSDAGDVTDFINQNLEQFKADDADGTFKKKKANVTAQMQKFIRANISPVVVMKAVGITGKNSPNWGLFEPEWQQQFLQDQASQVAKDTKKEKPAGQKSSEPNKRKIDLFKAQQLQSEISSNLKTAKRYTQAGDTKKAEEYLNEVRELQKQYEALTK